MTATEPPQTRSRAMWGIGLVTALSALVLLTSCGVWIGLSRQQGLSKQALGEWIVSHGGSWEECGWLAGKTRPTASMLRGFGIGEWPIRLWSVSFSQTRIGADELTSLRRADWIRKLDLSHTPITDQDLAPLAQLTELRELNLSHTAVTNAGLARLAPLKNLVVLDVTGTAVTYAGLAALDRILPGASWPSQPPRTSGHQRGSIRRQHTFTAPRRSSFAEQHAVRSLPRSASSPAFHSQSLFSLIAGDTLHCDVPLQIHLSLNLCECDEAVVEHLPYLQGLRNLTITGHNCEWPAGYSFLAALPALESLEIYRTDFGDSDLRFIAQLPHLKYLVLHGPGLTTAGVAGAKLPRTLESVHLGPSQVDPGVLDSLRQLTELRELELNCWVLDRRGKVPPQLSPQQIDQLCRETAVLAELPKLEYLVFSGNVVVDEVVAPLVELKHLKQLNIMSKYVSADALDRLRSAVPEFETH